MKKPAKPQPKASVKIQPKKQSTHQPKAEVKPQPKKEPVPSVQCSGDADEKKSICLTRKQLAICKYGVTEMYKKTPSNVTLVELNTLSEWLTLVQG